jgi:hypothetical protein
MVNAEYYVTPDFSLQVLLIPDLRFHKLEDLSFPEGTTVNSTKEPDVRAKNFEYGVRFGGFYNGWDLTLNYLAGWDDVPAFKAAIARETGALTITPEHERLHIVGGTVANVFWDTVVRAEVAAHLGKYFSVDDPMAPEMVTQKDLLSYAMAFERDLVDIHWIFQALQETILDYDAPITTDDVKTWLTLRGARTFLNDTLELSTFAIYNMHDDEWTLQPEATYAYSDAVSMKFGLDVVLSNDDSTNADDERLYAEFRYSF